MLDVRSVLICDDVRREDNGKLILIGVYSGIMIFDSSLNAILGQLRVFVSASTDLIRATVSVRIRRDGSDIPMQSVDLTFERMEGEVSGPQLMDFSIPFFNLLFEAAELHVIELKGTDGQWTKLMDFMVRFKEKQA